MNKITIKPCEDVYKYLQQIKKIDDECFSQYPMENYTEELILDILENPKSYCLVAVDIEDSIEKIVGYILISEDNIYYEDNEEIFDLLNENDIDNYMVIYSIGISEKYRGKGIATKLVDISCEMLRKDGYKTLYLEVRCSNKNAINLYKKNDFIEIQKLKTYYVEPKEEGLFMVKLL